MVKLIVERCSKFHFPFNLHHFPFKFLELREEIFRTDGFDAIIRLQLCSIYLPVILFVQFRCFTDFHLSILFFEVRVQKGKHAHHIRTYNIGIPSFISFHFRKSIFLLHFFPNCVISLKVLFHSLHRG